MDLDGTWTMKAEAVAEGAVDVEAAAVVEETLHQGVAVETELDAEEGASSKGNQETQGRKWQFHQY